MYKLIEMMMTATYNPIKPTPTTNPIKLILAYPLRVVYLAYQYHEPKCTVSCIMLDTMDIAISLSQPIHP